MNLFKKIGYYFFRLSGDSNVINKITVSDAQAEKITITISDTFKMTASKKKLNLVAKKLKELETLLLTNY